MQAYLPITRSSNIVKYINTYVYYEGVNNVETYVYNVDSYYSILVVR